jgi:MFS family permease
MIRLEFLTALVIALGWSGLYVLIIQRAWPRKRGSFVWLFVIIFLGTWLLGSLLRPFGPEVAGIRWMPFFLVGLVIFLVLAVAVPRRPLEGRRETLELLEQVERERELEAATFMTLNVFFWILICVLVVTLIIRYVV